MWRDLQEDILSEFAIGQREGVSRQEFQAEGMKRTAVRVQPPRPPQPCLRCGVPCEQATKPKLYCSARCRQLSWRRRHAPERWVGLALAPATRRK